MIDMLADSVRFNNTMDSVDSVKISIIIKGVLRKYVNGVKECILTPEQGIKVSVNILYTVDGFEIRCATQQSVNKWLSDGRANNQSYLSTTGYLQFINSIKEADIIHIEHNDTDLTHQFATDDNRLSIVSLCNYLTTTSDYKSLKVTVSNGQRERTFLYSDKCYTRYIKSDNMNTLYINQEDKMSDILNGYELSTYTLGKCLPDITTLFEVYENIATLTDKSFRHITS